MSDYEKSSVVAYPFYFINRQPIHKTNCMQRIKKILMQEVFPAIALKMTVKLKRVIVVEQTYMLHRVLVLIELKLKAVTPSSEPL